MIENISRFGDTCSDVYILCQLLYNTLFWNVFSPVSRFYPYSTKEPVVHVHCIVVRW